MLKELIFLVEEASEGGYTAQALGYSIFTEADTWDELKEAVQDAVRCHFEIGTLNAILKDVAQHLRLEREALIKALLEK